MSTVQHNFDKSWTTVAACRPYRYVLTSVPSVTLPIDLSGDTKIGPPAVLRTTMGEYSNHIWYGGEGGGEEDLG